MGWSEISSDPHALLGLSCPGERAARSVGYIAAAASPYLLRELRPLEVAAERRVGDLVVGGELPQGLAGRPASNQLLAGNEPAQSTPALHGRKSSRLPHHQRTSPQTAACQAADQRRFYGGQLTLTEGRLEGRRKACRDRRRSS
jgi:hypothetical protein